MMIKNKKSFIMVKTLVRVIVVIGVIFFLILPACNKVQSYFDTDQKYKRSFEKFVDKINGFPAGKRPASIELDKDSAIIGFSKNINLFECVNCWDGNKNIVFDKPTKNQECSESACICLCNEGFDSTEIGSGDDQAKVIHCKKKLNCKQIDKDVVEATVVSVREGSYFNNGFLFARDISDVNGLEKHTQETIDFVVDKTEDIIAVCTPNMLIQNNLDSCLIEETGVGIAEIGPTNLLNSFLGMRYPADQTKTVSEVIVNKYENVESFEDGIFNTFVNDHFSEILAEDWILEIYVAETSYATSGVFRTGDFREEDLLQIEKTVVLPVDGQQDVEVKLKLVEDII